MTAVKICGLTNLEDARWAWRCGADLLGFVFVSASPRCIAPADAARIVGALRDEGCRLRFVGVFANQPVEAVREIAGSCALGLVQLHGDEPPDYALSVGMPVIVARRVRDRLPPPWPELSGYRPWAYLLDTSSPAKLGGTGVPWRWELLERAPDRPPGRLIVAGGLTPGNVGRVVELVQPWGVDVSSGVEVRPGRKDPSAVERFVRAAKGQAQGEDQKQRRTQRQEGSARHERA